MNIIETLQQRGLVQDLSDPEKINNLQPGDSFYIGFDPTAPSLQLGNLIPMLVMIHLAQAGLKPVMLFGGATGAIGDPSGKNAERQLLPREIIDENIARQQNKATEIFARLGISVRFVNNYDWTADIKLLDFLRDVGKHFSVNYMIAKEVVKTRLNGDGISYAEFSYMLLQSHDYLHLLQTEGCMLQVGGSDQWGNITAGLEFIRRKLQDERVCAFSIPLLTDSQGKKYSKSEGGALWLSGNMTSPYRLHQYLLNTDDQDVAKLLKALTLLSIEEINQIEIESSQHPEKRQAQQILADNVCTLVHGESATTNARRSAEVLFGGSVAGLSDQDLEEIFADVPSITLERSIVASSSLVDLLVSAEMVKSKSEARRLIKSGGAYLNNDRISDGDLKVKSLEAFSRQVLVLRSGKKSYRLVRLGS